MKTKTPFRTRLRHWTCAALLAFGPGALPVHAGGKVAVWGGNTFGQRLLPNGLDNVKAIAAGSRHSLALKADGTVAAWGQTNNGGASIVPDGLSGVKAIAAGGNWNLALKTDGTVVGWGAYNSDLHVAGLSNITAIAAGWYHWLALKADGDLATWSSGGNSFTPNYIPAGISNVVAIAAGSEFSLALKSDGTVTAWGWNEYGQTNVPPGLSSIVAIATSAAASHSLALKADGTVVAWGGNWEGQANVPPNLTNVIAIAAGHSHSLALRTDGSVVAWGNVTGAYPDSSQAVVPPGLANVKAIAAGESHSLALVFDGPPEILTQPGNTEISHRSNVVLTVTATGTAPLSYQWYFNGTALTDSDRITGTSTAALSISNAQFTDAGNYSVLVSNAFGLVTSTGAVLAVISPPLITQQPFLTPTNQQSPMLYPPVPPGSSVVLRVAATGSLPLLYQWRFNGADVPGATNATLPLLNLNYVQSGYYSVEIRNAFGVTNSVKLLLNVSDVLLAGQPFIGSSNMPPALTDVIAVAAGGSHIMALKTDGAVRTWLANNNNLFGSPFAVTNIPASVTNVTAISAGYDHCLALRSNGTVVAWGSVGTHTNVPIGLSNVVAIAAGQFRSYAVKADGTVTSWGSSRLPTGLSNVVAMASTSSQDYALRRDGTVVYWPGTSAPFTVVSGLSNAIAIAAGSSGQRALRQDGTVVAWTGSSAPVPVMQGNFPVSNVVAVTVGSGSASLLLKEDGTLVTPIPFQPPFPVTNNLIAIAAGGVQSGFGVAVVGDGRPFFTLHPVSQVVQKSDAVQLHARAVGAPLPPPKPREPVGPALTFQWQHDGVNIPGATNASLLLSNVQSANIGDYRVIASNTLGLATSRVATISIAVNTNLAAALNATNLSWTTSGGATQTVGWFAQNRETHDGDAAAQSGAISHNQQSVLQTTVTGPGTVSFWWKVSSEVGYDFLRVYVDQNPTPLFSISGETDWEQKSITFTNGSHSVRWVYSKDGSLSVGRDAGFLDEVRFVPPAPEVNITPAVQTVSCGATAGFFAVTLSYEKPVFYQWALNGTNLVGATNQTLSLTNVGRKDAGAYSVWAANSGGGTRAGNATLNVVVPQQLGNLRWRADGGVELLSRDADGGAMSPALLAKFEAQVSSNLVDWVALPNALTVTNGSLLVRDPEPPRWPQRFYRIVEH